MAEPKGPADQVAQVAQTFVARGAYIPPHKRRLAVQQARAKAVSKPAGPSGWDKAKCKWGVPPGFGESEAAAAVNAADFSASVYVNTSAEEGKTRQAFTYVTVGDFRLCVVGHVHPKDGAATVAGNAYIPGFANWEMKTPAGAVDVIDALPDKGAFPGDARYPHQ